MTNVQSLSATIKPTLQDIVSTKTARANWLFLEALRGPKWEDVWVAGCNIEKDAGTRMFGGRAKRVFLNMRADEDNYYSIATVRGEARTDANVTGVWIVVLDDVGTKVDRDKARRLMPPPTYVIETSPGSSQWGYVLNWELTPVEWRMLGAGLVAAGLTDAGSIKLGQYVRLPWGKNNKAKYGPGGHEVRLTYWDPERRHNPNLLAHLVGVDLSPQAVAAWEELSGGVGSVAAGNYTASLAKPDAWVKAMTELGMTTGDVSAGRVHIRCPWSDEHTTQRDDTSTSYLGSERWKCQHDHCRGRGSEAFARRIREDLDAHLKATGAGRDAAGWLARAAFECEGLTPEDDRMIEDVADRIRAEVEAAEDAFVAAQRAAFRPASWDEVLDRYIPVAGPGGVGVFDRRDRIVLPTTAFDVKAHGLVPRGVGGRGRPPTPWQYLIETKREDVGGTIYAPGQKDICLDPSGRLAGWWGNSWKPGSVVPDLTAVDADVRPMLDHIAMIVPDAQSRDVILDHMAYTLQKPGKKIGWAVMLIGEMGTGKDLMLAPLLKILGKGNAILLDNTRLLGRFTDWLEHQLIVVEELAKSEVMDVFNKLKPLISNPPDTVLVERKGRDVYECENFQNWWILSNDTDALNIAAGDRRFFVYVSPAKVRDALYYDRLGAWQQDPVNLAKWAGWLMKRQLTAAFRPHGAPPDFTGSKARVIEAALPPVAQWLKEEIEAGAYKDRTMVTIMEIQGRINTASGVPAKVRSAAGIRPITVALKALGAVQVRNGEKLDDGKNRLRIWALRDADAIEKQTTRVILDAYMNEAAGRGAARFGPVDDGEGKGEDSEGDNVIAFPF